MAARFMWRMAVMIISGIREVGSAGGGEREGKEPRSLPGAGDLFNGGRVMRIHWFLFFPG